jgi:hypothetical protein
MTASPPPIPTASSSRRLLWAAVGGVVGWAVGFFGFAIHCAVFIPGPVPLAADRQQTPVTAYTQIYGHTIHEETGPFGQVLASGSRRANWIGWPVVAVSTAAGALVGVWMWRRSRRTTVPVSNVR